MTHFPDHFLSLYQTLINSPEQMAQVSNATSVVGFFATLKKMWRIEDVGDEQLLGIINECNQQEMYVDLPQFSRIWMAYAYHPRSQKVHWCLPAGNALEPFQDQYIERCRQHIVANQLLQPKISLAVLLNTKPIQPTHQPSGFIFHLSRCGSTLISGCLAEVETTNVASESPVLTEILLDSSLSDGDKEILIHTIISAQMHLFPARDKLIIKWNAWDILCWSLIRKRYPSVPVILVVREPVEILASHQRLAGRHMAGDPAMAGFNPLFKFSDNKNLLENRIDVLHGLLKAMLNICHEAKVSVVDYQQINAQKIIGIGKFFSINFHHQEKEKIQRRMQVHSKFPGVKFSSDVEQKQQLFSEFECRLVNEKLQPAYQQLLHLSGTLHE